MKIFQGIFCWHKQIIFEEHLCCKKKAFQGIKLSLCLNVPALLEATYAGSLR